MTPPASTSPCSNRRQRGSALVLVAVLGFLSMALWATAYRATHDGIRAEAFTLRREQVGREATEALARALALLSTGEPESALHKGLVDVPVAGGGTRAYIVTFTRDPSGLRYEVEARPADEREVNGIDPLPESFAPTRGRGRGGPSEDDQPSEAPTRGGR